MKNLTKLFLGAVSAAGLFAASPAIAQDAAAAAPAAAPVPMPAMAGPLANNPAPYSVDLSGAGFDWLLGKVYLSGAITGGVVGQTNQAAGDKNTDVDLFNGMAVAQKTDGFFQWYVQAGAYATPTLGAAYTSSSNNTTGTFSSFPQGYIKLVPTDSLSIQAGKLPTLIGAEYEFTYENMNVERGILWSQEPAVSRGAQVNYSSGPLSISAALTDGYYSDRYNQISGLISYGFNGGADTVALVGSGNLGHTYAGRAGSTLFQNNSSIFNAIYTHVSGNWTITPLLPVRQRQQLPGLWRTHHLVGQRRHPGQLCAERLLASGRPLRICLELGPDQHSLRRGQQRLHLHHHPDLAVQGPLHPAGTVLRRHRQRHRRFGAGPAGQQHGPVPWRARSRYPVLGQRLPITPASLTARGRFCLWAGPATKNPQGLELCGFFVVRDGRFSSPAPCAAAAYRTARAQARAGATIVTADAT